MANSTLVLVLLFILPILIFLLLKKLSIGRGASKLHLPPAPRGLPLIGNLHQLGHLPHRSLWRLSRSHGPVMLLRLGRVPTVVVSSAAAAREVLKTRDLDFCSRPRLSASSKIFYDNSDIGFCPYGEYWRQIRKLSVVELFSAKRVQSFHFVRREEVDLMIDSITASADNDRVLNLSEMLTNLANDIICRVAFGKKYPKEGLHRIMKEFQILISSLFVGDYFPFLGWIDNLTGLSNRLHKNVKELDFIYERVIQEHLDAKCQRPRDDDQDIVDVLLTLSSDLSMDSIKAVISDIFIAGTETASATIIWAMSELVKNPKLMKKAQEEVRSVVGSNGKLEEGPHLHQLQYLKAVIKETFRLHTPGPLLLPRESMRQTTIGGYDIPANTRVYVNAWGVGRDPESWEDDYGLEEFVPERFIGSSIDFQGQDFELIPFGSGRRICPGMSFGVVNIELILGSLLCEFDWELPEGMKEGDVDMEEAQGLVLHRKSPLFLAAKEAVL